jgi:hypothetical protein
VAEQAQAWRVATISHDPSDLWRVRPAEFATKEAAWQWALSLVWDAPHRAERVRTCYLVPVVEGWPVVPQWMAERMWPLEE